MTSFDFLRKLYRTSKSVVIIMNATNTIFWATHLNAINVTEQELRGEKAKEFFGMSPCQLYPGEFVANIKGNCYTYNVKTFADRTNQFIIIEIRTEALNHLLANNDEISGFIEETTLTLQKNTGDIMSIVDKVPNMSQEDYTSIVKSARQILNSQRGFNSIIETKNDANNRKNERCSLSELASKFTEDCEVAFKSKNIEVGLNCVEDIYSSVGVNSFNNLCISILNRLLCISDGYIDKININLEMLSDHCAELAISTESPSGRVRIANLDELKQKLAKKDAIGTDLFAIKYFCEKFNAEATQKINHEEHTTCISIKLPSCDSQGIMLFRSSEVLPEHLEKFSKMSIGLSDAISQIN